MNEENAHKKFKLSELAQVFTQDLEAAREGIIRSELMTNQKLHWLLNIGEYSIVERQIGDPSIDLPEKQKVGLRFRIAQHKGSKNPYADAMNANKGMRRAILNKGLSEGIILNGGLGDILERMSRLTKYGIEEGRQLNIFLSKKDLRIFKGLKINPCLKVVEHEINKGVGYNIFMASIGDELPEPMEFIEEETIPKKEKNILCCWSAAGSADKMSRWIRSVRHEDTKRFYESLEWENVNKLIDITEWKDWERNCFNKMGVQTISPTKETN